MTSLIVVIKKVPKPNLYYFWNKRETKNNFRLKCHSGINRQQNHTKEFSHSNKIG